jgi:hypothetical protein
MVGTTSNWEDELRGWLKPLLDRLDHKSRRLYVAGLTVILAIAPVSAFEV